MVTWTYALLSLKLYRPLLVANAAAAVVAVVATIELAPPFGAEGAAITTVIAEATLAAVSLTGPRHHRPALRPDLAVVPKVVAASGLAVAVALLVPAPVLVRSMLAGATYGVVALLLGAVPAEAITALRRRAWSATSRARHPLDGPPVDSSCAVCAISAFRP